MALVGKKFPNLNVDAMNEMGDTFKINVLEEAINNKKKVLLFWYPKDFTFVCPTELHAFQEALPEFEKRNTLVIGASCDTPEVLCMVEHCQGQWRYRRCDLPIIGR